MTTIELAESKMIKTYNRYPVVFDHGEGVYLYDEDGNKYLDFAAGIAVNALGYSCEEYKNALKQQIDKLMHCSNLFYNKPAAEACELLVEKTGMYKAFLANSGTEANEGAIKLARKFGREKGIENTRILAMNKSFHGRTLGALAVTGQPKYSEPFSNVITGVDFADFNDFESVKKAITEDTCGIILEPVQGEGGIFPATKEFIQNVRKLCDEKDILLIFDEIQCGIGRTGEWFAHEHYGVKPDIITLAKAVGGGIPAGAFVINEKADVFVPGDHGTTYGGNPLAATAIKTSMEIMEKNHVVQNAKAVGEYMINSLKALANKNSKIVEVRGLGLMVGIEINEPIAEVVNKCRANGLIIITAGANTLRLVPPLVITNADVDKMINILTKCL